MNKNLILLLCASAILIRMNPVDADTMADRKKMSSHDAQAEKINNGVLGIGILSRIPGLWNGPVSSTTPAGSFKSWYVDFRPVSPGQVSQYSTLDADTLNYISFFIVKHDGRLKMAMRTEGVFRNKGGVTYEVIDRVAGILPVFRFPRGR